MMGKINDDDDDEDDEKEDEDLDQQPDSDFENRIENVIEFNDIDYMFKGEDINTIGQIAALRKNFQEDLKKLNYEEIEAGAEPAPKEKNKFLME